MLEFKKFDFDDIPIFKKFFSEYKSRSCDYTVVALFMWRDYYQNSYSIKDDTLIMSSYYDGKLYFSYPIGKKPELALEEIKNYCRSKNIPVVFLRVDEIEKDKIIDYFPDCKVIENRDWADYIYDALKVKDLTGKDFSQKRNQIHKFIRNYENFEFIKIDSTNVSEVIEFNKAFSFSAEKIDDSADYELNACTEFLENFMRFDFPGYMLKIGGNIAGYTVGEIIGDTLFIHIEKADTQYRGVYQMLFYLFLKEIVNDKVKYVNREDDCGDPGLRKSKLSYNPVYLLKKYKIICE